MPIPFIAAGVIAATATSGIHSGVKATKNSRKAKSVNRRAGEMVEQSEERLNATRQITNRSIESLGEKKISILSNSIKEFISLYQLLKNVEINQKTIGVEELKNIGVSKDLLHDLEAQSYKAVKVASGGMASLGTGVAAAYGAYAGTMALGTASTGAAISGLSGVAATNATLAWLGGGALSAGGYGVAGGTMVLGGIVAGPALAVGGLVISSQSKKKLNSAYENLDEAKVIQEQMKSAEEVLFGIKNRANQLKTLLSTINVEFTELLSVMRIIIKNKGTDWLDYSQNEKEDIHKLVLLAQLIKGVIDTPLLEEDGEITKKSEEVLLSGKEALQKISIQKQAN